MEMQLWTLRILFPLRSDHAKVRTKYDTQSFRHDRSLANETASDAESISAALRQTIIWTYPEV